MTFVYIQFCNDKTLKAWHLLPLKGIIYNFIRIKNSNSHHFSRCYTHTHTHTALLFLLFVKNEWTGTYKLFVNNQHIMNGLCMKMFYVFFFMVFENFIVYHRNLCT